MMSRRKLAFTLVALLGFFLELLGTHGRCYAYGDVFLVRFLLVPPSIVLMWGVLGWAAWQMYLRWGLVAGALTPVAVDFLVLEPSAYWTGLWSWGKTWTPRVWFGSSIGNLVVYVCVALFAVYIYKSLAPEQIKSKQTSLPSLVWIEVDQSTWPSALIRSLRGECVSSEWA